MSIPFKQMDGPPLGALSAGTEKMEAGFEAKHSQQKTLSIAQFLDLKNGRKTKHFVEGPLPPLSPSQDENQQLLKTPDLGFSKKPFCDFADSFEPGTVKKTKGVQVLVDLAESVDDDRLNHQKTGCIIEEGFEPTGYEYQEGIHYYVEKNLNKGSYGSTQICVDGQSQKQFLRKQIAQENFRPAEVIVPLNLDHQNVTKLYGMITCQDNQQNQPEEDSRMVELMIEPAGIALNTYCSQTDKIETARIWDVTKQIMSGLDHMHNYDMIHLDMKPENLIIRICGSGCIVKITDFGSAKLPQERLTFVGWTPEYMCTETSRLFLFKQRALLCNISEEDITGKVDVYAAALVIMYLYVKVHVLQRLVTKGKSSYVGYSKEEIQQLQFQLMKTLATEPKLMQYVMPDDCDIDMRELLGHMTQFDYRNRFDAKQVLDFIGKRERRNLEAIAECKKRLQIMQEEKNRVRNIPYKIPIVPELVENKVPEIAYNCAESKNHIQPQIKNLLRQRLKPNTDGHRPRPYPGKGGKGFKGKGKVMTETPVEEMKQMVEKMDDYVQPPTPVTDVSLSLAKLDMKNSVQHTERKTVVMQPSTECERQSYRPLVGPSGSQPALPTPSHYRAPAYNVKVLPPQPFPDGAVVQRQNSVQPQQNTISNAEIIVRMQHLINTGYVGVKQTARGVQLVPVPGRSVSRVTPIMPPAPSQTDAGALEGNLPGFLQDSFED